MKKMPTLLIALLMSFSAIGSTWSMSFNSMYVFGDSLSDGGSSSSAVLSIYKLLGGNCDPSHPCPPYFEGRYSNGAVAAEYLAQQFLPGGASSTHFFNYAISGATTGIGNFGDDGTTTTPGTFGLPGLSQEIGLYLSHVNGIADPQALYFIWGGANDFLTGNDPLQAAQNITNYVSTLIAAGAESFFIPNLPDLGVTPFARIVGIETIAHTFTEAFNTELTSLLNSLVAQFPTVDIMQFDINAVLTNAILNPSLFGFTDVQNGCLLINCSNPEAFVFWDDFHPTTHAHAVFASLFANAIPVPATLFLVIIGLPFIRQFRSTR